MPFPVPEVAISTRGSGKSAAELANEAGEHRRAEQIRAALKVQHKPMMVSQLSEPSEAEQARERNARLQRHGTDAAAFRSQLRAMVDERDVVSTELADLRRRVDNALREGRLHDVRLLRSRIEDAALWIDRLEVLEGDVRVGLAQAERAEARELDALEASLPAAEADLQAWADVQSEYARLAARLAAIVAMEGPAAAAYSILKQATLRLPGRPALGAFPAPADGRPLRTTVVLPGHYQPPAARPSANDAYQR